jgi:alpha-methylacyl-CoA racemase
MGPLAGLRIVEMAAIGPGPMAAMLLADMGAEVIRVDRLEQGAPIFPMDARYEVVSRGRRSIALDLKRREGLDVLLRLADRADGLIEGFRPGVTERLGFGPEVCLARNPRLVYGRMTGWGQEGPLAHVAGHDINYIALAGALHGIGHPDEPPLPPLNLVGDYGGGAMFLAFGMASAFYERERSGRGQVVDAAMVDGAAFLMAPFFGMHAAGLWSSRRGDNLLDGSAPFYCCYATRDGRSVAVGCIENRFFAEMARRIGLPEHFVAAQNDRNAWPEMRAQLTAIFLTRTRDEWVALLEGSDACVTGVLDFGEAARHPHNAARNLFPAYGGVPQPAAAPRFSRSQGGRSQGEAPSPPPAIGAHTREVLDDCGYSEAEARALIEQGVAG